MYIKINSNIVFFSWSKVLYVFPIHLAFNFIIGKTRVGSKNRRQQGNLHYLYFIILRTDSSCSQCGAEIYFTGWVFTMILLCTKHIKCSAKVIMWESSIKTRKHHKQKSQGSNSSRAGDHNAIYNRRNNTPKRTIKQKQKIKSQIMSDISERWCHVPVISFC